MRLPVYRDSQMFDTLFKVKINWYVYFACGILLLLLIPGISIWCFLALMIALHQFLLVFYSVGYIIPIRYLAGALMSLQMLVGSSFAYLGLDEFQYFRYRMQLPEADYFIYAIPATVCFILGLHVMSRLRGEKINEEKIKEFVRQNPSIMYIFIVTGFLASFVSGMFGSELGFVFYLISGFKFVGAFMIITGGSTLKPLPLAIVFGSIILSSLGSAMFHDLIIWLVFLLTVLAIKFKPSVVVKGFTAFGFLLMIITIQQLKGTYRKATQYQGKEGSVEAFDDAFEEYNEQGGLFDKQSLAMHNVRINQGFIVTYIMNHVPAREPFANGNELYKILEAAFLPRVLAPNKLEAGDNSLVRQYSGLVLRKHTSMSLSAMGDGYINFGVVGGCLFMFCLGLSFNLVLIFFNRYSKEAPVVILFMPLIFYFPIRPDTALQTSLGHLVKASFLVYIFLLVWKYDLSLRRKTIQPLKA